MIRTFLKTVITLAMVLLVVSACGGEGQGDKVEGSEGAASAEPVTLKVYPQSVNLADEEFQQLMADPVKRKYPNITLELMKPTPGTELEAYVASGEFADIVFTGQGMKAITLLNLETDLTPWMKKNKIDVAKFDPLAIQNIQSYGKSGELVALPFSVNFSVLFYNKDLFDKFAVAYPKDGMTWDEAIALGKKMTREEGGVQYLGLNAQSVHHMASQLSLTYTDPKTNKAAFLTDDWKRLFSTYLAVSDLSKNIHKQLNPLFLNDRVLAMFGDYGAKIGQLEELANTGKPLNWDMAAMPVYPDHPKQAFGFVAQSLMISSLSKHKDEAFQAIRYLTSEEEQLAIVKKGRQSSLQGSQFEQGFGSELATMKGKNIQAIFKNKPAPSLEFSPFDDNLNDEVKKQISAAADAVTAGKKDINTALRELQEQADKIYAGK
ncbi:MAG: extracellular solute-binding protein family 1 [Paenibacillaceae bacterium]|jgi:multiple sugar transport system substrate-binding protein|nr:extracellular solute-binding protein family 1 [Paenibacillaceae bacterium]